MKYFFLFIIELLFCLSCNLYLDSRDIKIGGLSKGKIVLSSINSYYEFLVEDTTEVEISCNKGEIYFVSFYPEINNNITRYPLGTIINLDQEFVTPSPHLGHLTKICNMINRESTTPNLINLYKLRDLFIDSEDPWIYSSEDISLFLLDKIGFGSITTLRKYNLPELNYLYTWNSENSLFCYWYPSIQFFYNFNSDYTYRLEINEDGSYYGFEEVN